MTTSDEDAIAFLRIELEDIEPLIWRRVAVPTSMSLKAVHNVIQAAMGWLDNHLWEFKINDGKYGILIPNDPDWNERINNAATTKLSALLATGITEIGYIYDFGDNWQHRIIVEKLEPAEPGALYPQFLGGERRCSLDLSRVEARTGRGSAREPAVRRGWGKPVGLSEAP
jgi:hypothetical protein